MAAAADRLTWPLHATSRLPLRRLAAEVDALGAAAIDALAESAGALYRWQLLARRD